MKGENVVRELKEGVLVYWNARTAQEQKFLAAGAAVVGLALVYALLVDPAVSGRKALETSLPKLRQQAAEMQAMGAQASALAREGTPQVVPMTRETLATSLAARSLAPESVAFTGEYAKVVVRNVSFANLLMWLDQQRRANLVRVHELDLAAQAEPGMVSGSVMLAQGAAR